MSQTITRRNVLHWMGFAAGAALLPGAGYSMLTEQVSKRDFTYCLNMSTIRGHNLGMIGELEIASKAGFRSVEIWIDTLQTYLTKGGTTTDLKKRLNDLGIRVENCIGFAEWIVDDESRRKAGVEQLKREMDLLAQLGCSRIAAPPVGATETPGLDLKKAAQRYRTILELGDTSGVVPQLELWGFSKNLSRVSEVLYVAMESGHPAAKVLLDVYHLYKGGSPIDTLTVINSSAMDMLHVNDYPVSLSPADIKDADRVYPGDGGAPLKRILESFRSTARPLILSTEVFNKQYYTQDALTVARTALSKMKAVTDRISW